MKKKTVTWIVASLLLVIGTTFVTWSRLYVPDYPEGALDEKVTYAINPQTIFTSLDQGATDVFLPAPPEPEGSWPILWPPGSFVWDQEDYVKVADSLHQFIWKESLGNWHLIRASFLIKQCQDIFSGIDNASLSFFQRQEGQNIVRGFWLSPMYGNVTAGNQYSQRMGWTAKWETMDLGKIKINSIDAALMVAEKNGGEAARIAAKNECHINLLLSPDRFEYNFWSHPFRRYGWGWSVIYWPDESNADPIFSITINPYTGKYNIQDTNQ